MSKKEFPVGLSKENNPLTNNLYYIQRVDYNEAPIDSYFLTTEDNLILETESGNLIITEGTV